MCKVINYVGFEKKPKQVCLALNNVVNNAAARDDDNRYSCVCS